MKAHWNEDDGRILLGDNISGETVNSLPIKFQCFEISILIIYPYIIIIIIIIIIFLHGLGRLTCSGIDALPSFPGASTTPLCIHIYLSLWTLTFDLCRTFKNVSIFFKSGSFCDLKMSVCVPWGHMGSRPVDELILKLNTMFGVVPCHSQPRE